MSFLTDPVCILNFAFTRVHGPIAGGMGAIIVVMATPFIHSYLNIDLTGSKRKSLYIFGGIFTGAAVQWAFGYGRSQCLLAGAA